MQDAVVQKQIRHRLPNPEQVGDCQRDQAEFALKPYRHRRREEKFQERLHKEHARASDDDVANGRSQRPAPTEAVA